MTSRGAAVAWALLLLLPGAAVAQDAGDGEGAALDGFELPLPAAGGAVPVRVEPSRLLPGGGGECAVSAPLPPGARDVRVLAARGAIDEVVLEGDGVRARYRPPRSYLPGLDAVAVLAVAGGRTLFGFAAVQLVGQGQAVIRTRPLAEAVIDIRGVRFGPARADRRGDATIRVMVPPGTVSGTDGEGGEVDLKVPATGRLFAFAAGGGPVEGGEGVDVFAVVLDPAGGAAAGDARPSIRASFGAIEERESPGAGIPRWRFTAPAGSTEGGAPRTATIDLALEGEESSAARIELEVLPPPPGPGPEPEPEPGPEPEPEREPPWTSLAPEVGWATDLGGLHALALALELGVRLPVWAGRLRVLLESGFAWSRTSDPAAAGGERVDLDASTWIVPFTLGLGARLPVGGSFALALSARGGGATALSRIEGGGGPTGGLSSGERATFPAAGGALAVEREWGPGALLVEADFLWVGGELESLRGRLSLLSISLGYRLDLW